MKILLSLVMTLAIYDQAIAQDAVSFTTKQDVQLSPGDYPSEFSICFDAKERKQVDKSICRASSLNQRFCEVFFYNFEEVSGEQKFIPAGSKFFVTKQFGPDIMHDWSKKTSMIKFFSNLTGKEEPLSNPNLIIQCYHTKKSFLGPSLFSIDEIQDLVKDYIEIQ